VEDKKVEGHHEKRVKQVELMKTLQEAKSKAEKRKAKIDSAILIRDYRER
jgi:hypothetical protein